MKLKVQPVALSEKVAFTEMAVRASGVLLRDRETVGVVVTVEGQVKAPVSTLLLGMALFRSSATVKVMLVGLEAVLVNVAKELDQFRTAPNRTRIELLQAPSHVLGIM